MQSKFQGLSNTNEEIVELVYDSLNRVIKFNYNILKDKNLWILHTKQKFPLDPFNFV